MRILVTGATGYIGGRLVPRLLEAGHEVRVLVRDARRVRGREWADDVDVREGDLLKPRTLQGLGEGMDAAYYLVHSMKEGRDYEEREERAAKNFVKAVKGVEHVIYLGGLLPRKQRRRSSHLRSRANVGRILRTHLPVTEFRAGPIIGSGSASFEMVRYLTERLPVMVTPRWIDNQVQPIAVRDVLSYLITALEKKPAGVVEIGGERLTFRRMMEVFAEIRGLKRVIFASPVLAPTLAARWVGFVTPITNSIAVPLVQGVVSPVIADTKKSRRLFPEIEPISYRRAVQLALERIRTGEVATRWTGALARDETMELRTREGLEIEERSILTDLPPQALYNSFSGLGGDRGWLVWEHLWRIRGVMDLLIGGPGLRRGRRHPTELLPGEVLDFWRVEAIEPPKLLRLRAEMRVPGRAWLEWETYREGDQTRLIQRAIFAPRGLLGLAYWYAMYPAHQFIFSDMVRAIAQDAERPEFQGGLPLEARVKG